jgi:cobalamin biosynthesis Mg chelatase CobN
MAEETQQPEMGEPQEQPNPTPAEMVSISAAELAEIRSALKKANGEAARYRKTAEQVETERKAKEEAEMTALEKANKRAEEAEARAARLERERLQVAAAKKAGLPEELADRLKGETPEELEADAQAILSKLPKPPAAPKPGPGILPANPGTNGSTGETREARRARLGL